MVTPTATVVGTRLDLILLAIQQQLMTALSWSAERVLLTDPALLDALDYNPQADSYLALWPDTETADRPIFEGAGRLDTRCTERLFVEIRTRLALDEPANRTVWLTDPTLGHLPTRHQVWNALIEFIPTDVGGNMLTTGPIFPSNGQRPRPDLKKKEWGRSSLAFDVQYVLALVPTTSPE